MINIRWKWAFCVVLAWLSVVAAMAQSLARMPMPTQHLLTMNTVHCLMQDSEGLMWYGTPGGGLCRDNGYQVDVLHATDLLGDGADDVLSIAECLSDGNIWVTTNAGVFVVSKSDYSIHAVLSHLSGKRANHVMAARDGTMWVAQTDTVFHLDATGMVLEALPSVFAGKKAYVMNLVEDSHQRIWGAQWNGGLLMIDASGLHSVEWPSGVMPGPIVEDTVRQCFYVGTWGSGIYRMRWRNGHATYQPFALPPSTLHLPPSTLQSQIIDLLADQERGLLWCVTMDGLMAFNIETGVATDISSLGIRPGAILDWIRRDRDGHIWVAGFSPTTFAILTPEETAWQGRKTDGDVGLQVTCKDGLLWVNADRKGLQCFNPQTGVRLLIPSNVSDPFADRPKPEPPTHTCKDARGHIWTQDNHSVTETNPANDARRTLSTTDGTLPLEYVMDICPAGDGICVVGAWGMVMLPHCDALDGLGRDVRPAVTSYIIDGKETLCSAETTRSISLSSHFDAFTLRLSTFDPLHAATTQMAWRLSSEADTTWHVLPVGTNELTIYELPLGSQDVLVKATDGFGRWGRAVQVCSVERSPAWYETWAFRLAVLCVLLFLPYLYIWLRRRHQRELEELRLQFVEQIRSLQQTLPQPLPVREGSDYLQDEKLSPKTSSTENSIEEVTTPLPHREGQGEGLPGDRLFVTKATQSVQNHMSDDSFTVDQMASDLCMSRMNLYRKMRAACGMSPSDFIRNQRLEHAAHLLTTTDHSIVQIADLCGFSTPSYFAKCFKEKFGITPKEERK